MNSFLQATAVFVGAGLGALLRWQVGLWLQARCPATLIQRMARAQQQPLPLAR